MSDALTIVTGHREPKGARGPRTTTTSTRIGEHPGGIHVAVMTTRRHTTDFRGLGSPRTSETYRWVRLAGDAGDGALLPDSALSRLMGRTLPAADVPAWLRAAAQDLRGNRGNYARDIALLEEMASRLEGQLSAAPVC